MTRYLIPPTPAEDLPPPPTAQDFNIPDEAFGARTAFDALEPGEQLDPGYWDEANRANSTRAAELQNQFLDKQREILHTGPDAYLGKTGRDAVLAAPDVLSQLEAARQETIGQAANDAQRRLLTSALGEHRITEHYRVGTHAGEQSLEWQKQTATERLNQLRQQAALDYADPGSIEAYARASESAAQERARTMKFGKNFDEAQAEVDSARSSIWRSAIEAALDRMHTTPAIALFQQAADRLSPDDATALGPQIDAAKEHEAGQAYLTKVPIPDTRDLDELDAAHRAATARNETDWPDNDSQRATNQYFIDGAFNLKKRDGVQAKADLDRSVQAWLSQPGQILRPPPDVWARLDLEERQAVDDRLVQNMYHPTTDNDVPEPDTGGDAPVVEPLPESPHDEAADEEPRRIQAADDDPAQWEKGRATTEAIVRQATADAQSGKSSDAASDPSVRAKIEHGLTNSDPQERLKWARAPLYQYKSSLSDDDFARLADLQRRISPYDGAPREGLGHPIGTLEQHAELAAALTAGRLLRPFISLGRIGLAKLGKRIGENSETASRPEESESGNAAVTVTPTKERLTRKEQFAINRAQGRRFEEQTEERIVATGQEDAAAQITIKTKSENSVRMDLVISTLSWGDSSPRNFRTSKTSRSLSGCLARILSVSKLSNSSTWRRQEWRNWVFN